MQLIFDVRHLYYLPQYLPIYQELQKRQAGHASFVFYRGIHDNLISDIIQHENLTHVWVDNEAQAADYYHQQAADWVFFANGFDYIDRVHQVSKSAQIGHGIGPKSCYYTQSNTATTVRFVEGNYRTKRLQTMYPEGNFVDVGFCKLDPLLNKQAATLDLVSLGLDPSKKTLLYAPTFYPSSIELFPKDWPQAFSQYNILLKPHYFSLSKSKYINQRKLLEHWQQFNNVYLANVCDYSLVPFMATADVLISDASSALFEFAALNKPVVWCDFLKLRWSYRGIFSYRFKRRMDEDYGEYADIAVHAAKYASLKAIVDQQISTPEALEASRHKFAEKLAGKLDGKASERVVNYLIENS